MGAQKNCSCKSLLIGIPKGSFVQILTDSGGLFVGNVGKILDKRALQLLPNANEVPDDVINICCSKIVAITRISLPPTS